MSERDLPIGLFDSGVGGLTVLAAMLKRMPNESYAFLGDTARLPYGTKSSETIIRYSLQTTAKLVELGIKALVIACNTATSAALPTLRAAYPGLPVIGVVEPGAAAACAASRTGRIAVIATKATVRGGAYERAIRALRPDAWVQAVACPLFVPMAEDGLTEGPLAEGMAQRYLGGVFNAGIKPDCLVLGCTHFPLLKKAIRAVVGDGVAIVDSAETTAGLLEKLLRGNGMETLRSEGTCRFLTTDDPEGFADTGSRFLGMRLSAFDVELVDL
ncbi:MAG: glutamate racemase [Mailhella sp.]|nr:glutamate racemase [Mailhella sp.]